MTDTQTRLKCLLVRFSNPLNNKELEYFRGAVIHAMENASVLFHNHENDGQLRYSYPLVQYKCIQRKAAIFCIGEGTEVIGDFFSNCHFDVCIGERETTLDVETVKASRVLVQVWQDMFTYHIRKWLPLNQKNYEQYQSLDSLAEKYALLERLLTSNILSFAKGIGVHFDEQVVCKITNSDEPKLILYKGVKMMSFDAEFKTNVSLPDYVGLGKGVSLGMGTVVRRYEKKNEDNNE